MESWALQQNSLLNFINTTAVEPVRPVNYKNTLKTMVKSYPINVEGSATSIYGRRIQFKIPRAYTGLSQLYIKCTLSTSSEENIVDSYFASKIFSEISLATLTGTTLQRITPEYTAMRIDSLYNTPLYDHISLGLEPSAAFTTGTVTCVVPLFFFFSDNIGSFLDTRNLEQLVVNCKTAASFEAMGMSIDLTSATYELFNLFHDENTSNKFSDQYYSIKSGLPKNLISTYNANYEDDVECLSGTTSARLLLRSNHPNFVLHMGLFSAGMKRFKIKKVTVNVAGTELMVIDHRMNYQFYSNNNSFSEPDTLSIWLNKTGTRVSDSGLTTFSGYMFPTYIDVEFDALDQDYTLKTFEEYRSLFSVTDRGFIRSSTDDEYETYLRLDQTNSSTQAITS